MKLSFNFISPLFLSLLSASIATAQLQDPIPEDVNFSGQIVKLQEYAVIPPSSATAPLARINLLREVPDGSNRLFVNDLRGKLWVLRDSQPGLFLDLVPRTTNFIDSPGKGTGFGAFAFHPAYASNGIFYTAHTEATGTAPADFSPLVFSEITMQWVLTEWTSSDPTANTFSGDKREILRFDFPGNFHGMQEIVFNPNAQPGDEEYGLLYVCLGDGATSLNSLEENLQTTHSFLGTIFRIDPSGANSANGKYGIPSTNPFVGTTDTEVLTEIYAYGFRNPHRISWDTDGDHIMLEGDIGEKNIEELNQILPGHNYGWSNREGTFLYDRSLGRDFVYPLPSDDSIYQYTYPVAQYDHDVGVAILGGYVYRGTAIPELQGEYVFGDIVSGLLFHTTVSDLQLGQQGTIQKIATLGPDGFGTTLLAEVNNSRADLRFGTDAEGEIYLLTKADGQVRKIVNREATSSLTSTQLESANFLAPNPSSGILVFQSFNDQLSDHLIQIMNSAGQVVSEHSSVESGESIKLGHLSKGVYTAILRRGEKAYRQQILLR